MRYHVAVSRLFEYPTTPGGTVSQFVPGGTAFIFCARGHNLRARGTITLCPGPVNDDDDDDDGLGLGAEESVCTVERVRDTTKGQHAQEARSAQD